MEKKRRITIETAIISSIKVPLTDSIAFLISSSIIRRFEGHLQAILFDFFHFSFTASITLSAFSP
jgi:hypothetical protein